MHYEDMRQLPIGAIVMRRGTPTRYVKCSHGHGPVCEFRRVGKYNIPCEKIWLLRGDQIVTPEALMDYVMYGRDIGKPLEKCSQPTSCNEPSC